MVDGIVPTLAGGPVVLARSIACQVAESVLAEPLGAIQALHPDVDIGSYPWYRGGQFGVSLVARGIDADIVDGVADEIARMVRSLGGEPVAEDSA
jgi:hypothetical protein